jgi:hypothetical protein
MARAILTTQAGRRATWEPLYDTDPHTGATLEVFCADQVLAGSFGVQRAGWIWWTLPITPPTGLFATSYARLRGCCDAAVHVGGVLE